MAPDEKQQNQYLIPASIVVAGFIVALAVIYSNGAGISSNRSPENNDFKNNNSPAAENIKPVSSDDHILGNPNAPIKIVEFSDLECPFCKSFHGTMKAVLDEYGKDGKVAWVYRHFPLDSIHPRAPKEAEASECAWELGGNEKFWAYVDRVFEVTPSNNGLNPARLPEIAVEIGLDRAKFESCLSSGKYAEKVRADFDDAIASGGNGTPYTIVVTEKGDTFPFSGALPFSQVKIIIEQALSTL